MKRFILLVSIMVIGSSSVGYSQSLGQKLQNAYDRQTNATQAAQRAEEERYSKELIQKFQTLWSQISSDWDRQTRFTMRPNQKDIYVLYLQTNGQSRSVAAFPAEFNCTSAINNVKMRMEQCLTNFINGLPSDFKRRVGLQSSQWKNDMRTSMNQYLNFTYRKERNPNYNEQSEGFLGGSRGNSGDSDNGSSSGGSNSLGVDVGGGSVIHHLQQNTDGSIGAILGTSTQQTIKSDNKELAEYFNLAGNPNLTVDEAAGLSGIMPNITADDINALIAEQPKGYISNSLAPIDIDHLDLIPIIPEQPYFGNYDNEPLMQPVSSGNYMSESEAIVNQETIDNTMTYIIEPLRYLVDAAKEVDLGELKKLKLERIGRIMQNIGKYQIKILAKIPVSKFVKKIPIMNVAAFAYDGYKDYSEYGNTREFYESIAANILMVGATSLAIIVAGILGPEVALATGAFMVMLPIIKMVAEILGDKSIKYGLIE